LNWLLNLLLLIWRAVLSWFDPPYRTVVAKDVLPSRLTKRTLYIVEDDGYEEQVAMLCPCGCGRVLHMNLLPDERPCWKLIRHMDGSASLHPSVWRKKDCGSHFWFKKGKVQWCRERGAVAEERGGA
jgi:hypothetical protein